MPALSRKLLAEAPALSMDVAAPGWQQPRLVRAFVVTVPTVRLVVAEGAGLASAPEQSLFTGFADLVVLGFGRLRPMIKASVVSLLMVVAEAESSQVAVPFRWVAVAQSIKRVVIYATRLLMAEWVMVTVVNRSAKQFT